MDGLSIINRYNGLVSQRDTADNTNEVIEKLVVPYRGDFFKPLSSMGEIRWRRREIFDSTAPVACDTLISKLHTNLTNPNIRWFDLGFRDDKLKDNSEAVEWIQRVRDMIWQTYLDSNINSALPETYLDIGSFGTGFLYQEQISEDYWQGITFTSSPVRNSYFEMGAKDQVLRSYRLLQYTVLQLKDKFPDQDFDSMLSISSDDTTSKNVDQKYDVIFCVYARPDILEEIEKENREIAKAIEEGRTPKVPARRKAEDARPYGWKYVMHAQALTVDSGGYYEMPCYVTRWKKVNGTDWGHSPAHICLSDIIELNQTVADYAEARAKEVNPPTKGTMRGVLSDLDQTPGGHTVVKQMDQLSRLLEPNVLAFNNEEIDRLQKNIRANYHTDQLEMKESPVMTATEVNARRGIMNESFAPTLGRLQSDLLDKMITGTYEILARTSQLPDPPEGMNFTDLDIEYIGPIPLAMKQYEAQGISNWIGQMAGLTEIFPDVRYVPDQDKVSRRLGYALGVDADLMNTSDEVKAAKAADEAAQKEMMEFEKLKMASEAANKMGATQEEAPA